MRAAIAPCYGPPETIQLVELPDPAPGPAEILVRIYATTVSSGDARVRGFNVPGVFWVPARLALGIIRPRRRVLGTEFSGVVEAVGESVTRFRPGDRVFGMASFSKPQGTHAEYLTVASDGLVEPVPEGMGFDEAGCLCFGLLTARHFLQKAAKLRQGERVLVIGASGAVGCAAVQLAKHIGAHVTAVCSTRNVELAQSLGADEVIDYTRDVYSDLPDAEDRYDVILDTVGASTPFVWRRALSDHGRFIAVVMDGKTIAQAIWLSLTRSMRVILGVASEIPADLVYFREMVEAGAYRSVIDRCYSLDEIHDAHRHVDDGHKRGNVVILMQPDDAVRD